MQSALTNLFVMDGGMDGDRGRKPSPSLNSRRIEREEFYARKSESASALLSVERNTDRHPFGGATLLTLGSLRATRQGSMRALAPPSFQRLGVSQ
eukprot:2400982-Amphidinium_carterae.2